MFDIETAERPETLELGPLQKEWIARLRANPEKQMREALGRKTKEKDEYKACCLGEAGLMLGTLEWKEFGNSQLLILRNPGEGNGMTLYAHEKLGLRTSNGSFWELHLPENEKVFASLSDMNDNGYTWAEIADYIEANPTNVFFKSV